MEELSANPQATHKIDIQRLQLVRRLLAQVERVLAITGLKALSVDVQEPAQ